MTWRLAAAVVAALAATAAAQPPAPVGGCEVGNEGICAVVGNFHVLTFDAEQHRERRSGAFWLVNSPQVKIQGLFKFTSRFPGVACLTGLIVTGDSISGHTLRFEHIGPAEWQTGTRVTWDNHEVLPGFPSEYSSPDGILRGRKQSVDAGSAHKVGGTLPVFEFYLGTDLFVYIVMGPDFASAAVRMKKPPGAQDGVCGNFNCVGADDVQAQVQARGFAQPLSAAESLFGGVPGVDAQPAPDRPCDPPLEVEARRICADAGSRELIDACAYDSCRAGSTRVTPVLEAMDRMLWKEVQKLRAPAPPAAPPMVPLAVPPAVPAAPAAPTPAPWSPEATVAPDAPEATAPQGGAMQIHVGCPCAGAAGHATGHCPCASHCPCAMHAACPCAQVHMQTCPCLHNHTDATPCQCAGAAMAHCPCVQAAAHCPCAQHPVVTPNIAVVEPAVGPTGSPGPLMRCDLNCYGGSAKAVELPSASGTGDMLGVSGLTLEACRDYCLGTPECEGIVFGGGECYGKRDIVTSKCQAGAGSYSTEILRSMPKGICGLFGDPHIVTFDDPTGDTIDQFNAGEYVLLRSVHLQFNGRFGYSKRFPDEASTIGLAVAGVALRGHRLVVQYVGPATGYSGFKAYWDGRPILERFPSGFDSEDGVLSAEVGNMDPDAEHPQVRHTIGGAPGSGMLPSYRFTLLPDTKIYIVLGEQIMNVVIEVHQQSGGVDGYCGNFNCDASDDTLAALETRGLAAVVPPAQSLFVGMPPPLGFEMTRAKPPVDLTQCDPSLRSKAETACASMPASQREACVYDACASGSVSLSSEDAAVSRMEGHMAVDIGALAGKFWRGLLVITGGPQLPASFFLAVGAIAAGSLFGCTMVGRLSRGGGLHGGGYQRVRVSDGPAARVPGVGRFFRGFARDMRFSGYFSDDVASEHTAVPIAGDPLLRHSFDGDEQLPL